MNNAAEKWLLASIVLISVASGLFSTEETWRFIGVVGLCLTIGICAIGLSTKLVEESRTVLGQVIGAWFSGAIATVLSMMIWGIPMALTMIAKALIVEAN